MVEYVVQEETQMSQSVYTLHPNRHLTHKQREKKQKMYISFIHNKGNTHITTATNSFPIEPPRFD